MKIKGDRILLSFVAGEDLTEGDAVYLSAANTVKKVAAANAAKAVGVADASAVAGADVDVVVYGKKTVTAGGTIAVGDRVVAASTAGRVVTENSGTTSGHTHTENTAASYTQNATTASGTDTLEHARVIGKALGAAASAGDTLDILVCLA